MKRYIWAVIAAIGLSCTAIYAIDPAVNPAAACQCGEKCDCCEACKTEGECVCDDCNCCESCPGQIAERPFCSEKCCISQGRKKAQDEFEARSIKSQVINVVGEKGQGVALLRSFRDEEVGFWLSGPGDKQIGLFAVDGQVGVGVANSKIKHGWPIALTCDKDGEPSIQLVNKAGKVIHLDFDELAVLDRKAGEKSTFDTDTIRTNKLEMFSDTGEKGIVLDFDEMYHLDRHDTGVSSPSPVWKSGPPPKTYNAGGVKLWSEKDEQGWYWASFEGDKIRLADNKIVKPYEVMYYTIVPPYPGWGKEKIAEK